MHVLALQGKVSSRSIHSTQPSMMIPRPCRDLSENFRKPSTEKRGNTNYTVCWAFTFEEWLSHTAAAAILLAAASRPLVSTVISGFLRLSACDPTPSHRPLACAKQEAPLSASRGWSVTFSCLCPRSSEEAQRGRRIEYLTEEYPPESSLPHPAAFLHHFLSDPIHSEALRTTHGAQPFGGVSREWTASPSFPSTHGRALQRTYCEPLRGIHHLPNGFISARRHSPDLSKYQEA